MTLLKVLFSTLLLLSSLWSRAEDSLTVAVAANVRYAFDDLALAFFNESGIQIKPVYNSSGKIVTQVREGAPYDLFLSADMDYPQKLVADGWAVNLPKVYAYGKLVIWTTQPALDVSAGLQSLTGAQVKHVALANPKLAPYGAEALKAIQASGLHAGLNSKLIYAENIAGVLQYVETGHAEAGITAKSLVTAPELKGKGQWVELPANLYQPIAQGAVMLRYGQANHGEATRKFYGFLYSEKARAILAQFDYGLP